MTSLPSLSRGGVGCSGRIWRARSDAPGSPAAAPCSGAGVQHTVAGRLTSNNPSVHQADSGKDFALDMKQGTKGSSSGLYAVTSDKNTDPNNCCYKKSHGKHDGLATPPHDWVKNHSRICIPMKPRNLMKPLSFPATSNASTSHSLEMKPLEKKKKRKVWEDSQGARVCEIGGVCEEEKSTPSNPSCHSHIRCSDHSVFLCHCERAQYNKNPTEFANGSIATNICIPGSTAETEVLTKQCCQLLDGMVKSVIRSHQLQICYNGKLSMRNFRCNDAGQVKLDLVEPLPLTNSAAKEDKKRTAALIREEFFRERVLPTGIESLLSLMESEDPQNGELIEYHASREPPLKRLPLYEFIYRA